MVEPVFDVGLHLIHDGAGWVVTSIDNSGSAAAAGVMPGDLLSHINGNSVATLSSRQISSLLRGAAGSHCSLSLSRSTMGGGSAHLEASVQRKILSYPDALSPRELPRQQPAKPAAASMSNLHVLPRSSRSPVYADPEDSDPDAEAKLHFQLSLISQRLDEMEQKIRAPSAHSDKLLTPASAPNALAATHPDSASSAVGGGSAIFSLKSPARPPLGHRFSSTSPSVSQSTVAPSPSRTAKSSVVQPLRSPANRAAARPSSASSNITSPSKVGADLSANHAVGHLTPAKLVTSSVSPTVDKARAVKSNLFSPRSANAPNASAPPALASVATAHTETFRSNSQVLPLQQPHQQEPMHQHMQPQQHHIHSMPQHDQQQPLQLQQLLQKLLRQVDEAERQRLVRLFLLLLADHAAFSHSMLIRNSTRCAPMMRGGGKILCAFLPACCLWTISLTNIFRFPRSKRASIRWSLFRMTFGRFVEVTTFGRASHLLTRTLGHFQLTARCEDRV